MESPGSGAADCGVGSIVWVRRRNGSWWPGKILGPDELSASHLTSPRSGTPVKLLGREDASVDWYNLEKSKRVKAFRCGEFDDCIERAESSQGMPIKKREKYARREDAILHALELEKELKKLGKPSLPSDHAKIKSSGTVKKGLSTSAEHLRNNNLKVENSDAHQFSKRTYLSCNNEIIDGSLSSQKAKEESQLSGEDDHSEVIPRMRGLQDFGLKITPSKRKFSSPGDLNGSHHHQLVADNNAQTPQTAHSTSDTNGVEQMGVIFRSKRRRCVYMPPESTNSLESEEIPPSQIEFSVSHLGPDRSQPRPSSMFEANASAFMEAGESDSSGTESSDSETDSDSSETEQDVDDETATLSEVEPSSFGISEMQEHGSMSSEEPDDSGLSGDTSHLYPFDPVFANEMVSKWQLKGKRNIRNLTKKSVDRAYHESGGSQRTRRQNSSLYRNDDFDYSIDDDDIDMTEKDFRTKMYGLENGRYLKLRTTSKGQNRVNYNLIDCEDLTWEDRSPLKGYWNVKRERFGPFYRGHYNIGGRMRSMLVDVDLKVQASYRKEPVPIVSLMSKLNGKAIIGHPIQIEVLEDGSSSSLLSTTNNFANGPIDRDGNTTIPHAWSTARRTATFRAPRPHLPLDGDEPAYDHPYVDQERRLNFKKSDIGNFSQNGSPVGQRSLPCVPRPPNDKKLPRKIPKKVSLTSNQKTRALSSIAVEPLLKNLPMNDSISCQTDGLIKPESSGLTTVACIPVKLVFSRLLEKINRPPSKATSSMVLLSSGSNRNT